jgi:hypothetical protein
VVKETSGESWGPGPPAIVRVSPVSELWRRTSVPSPAGPGPAKITYCPSMDGSVSSPGPATIHENRPTGFAAAAQGTAQATSAAQARS